MDPQLLLFKRQYFQLFEPDFLTWPPKQLLRDAGMQAWLFDNMFNKVKEPMLPSERYQFRVLKPLMSKIESSIQNPEEDEVSDDLMARLGELVASDLPSESTAVQQKSYVTFACISPTIYEDDTHRAEPTITLFERRNLISGSKTTGFRTWEAALHLGSFLMTAAGKDWVADKNILELGAGTGFVSILCAKHLHANRVTTTDGDEGVVEALRENLFLNGLDNGDTIDANVLRWGMGLKGTWLAEECESRPFDLIIGADVTYEKTAISALVATLRFLLELRPALQIVISGAVRNTDTFEFFQHACSRNKFRVSEISYEPKPIREQESLFYATAVPLKILSIRGPESDEF